MLLSCLWVKKQSLCYELRRRKPLHPTLSCGFSRVTFHIHFSISLLMMST